MIPKPTYKHRPKQHTFTAKTKAEIRELQNNICAEPGCGKPIEEFHHNSKKNMGSSTVWWMHDKRNGTGLCWHSHKKTEDGPDQTFWKLFYEARGVVKHDWWRGQAITLDEWVSVNEYRLQKAGVDVREIIELLGGLNNVST